jgi:hypothetical protein
MWHTLALKSDGTVAAWGNNAYLQTNVPAGLSNVVAISAGQRQSVALKGDGSVAVWGDNFYGEGSPPPGPNTNFIAISSGYLHNLGLKTDGRLVSWGSPGYALNSVPVGLTNVVAISAGAYRNLAVTAKLRIDFVELIESSPVIHFHSFAGQQYQVDCSPGLVPNDWTPLLTNKIPGCGHDTAVTDTNALRIAPARFYRVKLAH